MLLMIDDQLANDLKNLGTFPFEVIQEFIKVAVESIFKEINTKMFISAASKLGTTAETIRISVDGLVKLFVEATKLQLQVVDLITSLKLIDLPDEVKDEVVIKYQELNPELKEMIKMNVAPRRRYKDLEWRADVKVASRSLHHQIKPTFLLKLHTSTLNDLPANHPMTLELDPANLKHLTKSLEEALREIDRQAHCRRILRNF